MNIINSQQIGELEKPYRTALMNSISGYKPLNLLGTTSANGQPNLCIVSSVFHMGSNPPLLGMVMRPARPHNDTLNNIKALGEYTLNNVTLDNYKKAHQTSASYPSGLSEFDECGLSELYQEGFKAPFVAGSTIMIALEFMEAMDIPLNGTTIVIGKIKLIMANDDIIMDDGSIDHVAAGSLAGSGLDSYLLPQLVDRLAYAKPDMAPTSILPKA